MKAMCKIEPLPGSRQEPFGLNSVLSALPGHANVGPEDSCKQRDRYGLASLYLFAAYVSYRSRFY